MKITLSHKEDPRGLHAVLICDDKNQANEIHPIIVSEILQRKANPVRELMDDGKVVYRFNLKYLDMLGLAFPSADLSKGIHSRMKRAEEVRLNGMVVPKLEIPKFSGRLYDYQAIATEKIVEGEIDYLNDEMGLGKTFIVLAAIRMLESTPALWICPNGTKYTTAEVARDFFGFKPVVIDAQIQTPAERQALIEKRSPLTIINIEAMRARPIVDEETGEITAWDYANPSLFDYAYSFASLDEHHRVKTPTAQATFGFFQLLAEQWIYMSGTPILSRPEEIWTTLHKTYPERYPDFDDFKNDLVIYAPGSTKVIAYKPRQMAELKTFLSDVSIRRRKDQVLKDLPETVEVPRYIQMTTEQERLYTKIQEEFELEVGEDEEGNKITQSILGYLPQITRLRQACFSPELYGGSSESAKILELKNIVRELVDSGEKAIIFSQWSSATRILRRELEEYNPAYVTGEIRKLKDRQEQIKKFREDETCKLYIGTIDANREGINLGSATYVIFTDEGWTPAGQDQAIGRSAAGGLRGVEFPKGTKVHVIYLRVQDSIEEWLVDVLKVKKNISNRMIERDGGKVVDVVDMGSVRELLKRKAGSKARKKREKKR